MRALLVGLLLCGCATTQTTREQPYVPPSPREQPVAPRRVGSAESYQDVSQRLVALGFTIVGSDPIGGTLRAERTDVDQVETREFEFDRIAAARRRQYIGHRTARRTLMLSLSVTGTEVVIAPSVKPCVDSGSDFSCGAPRNVFTPEERQTLDTVAAALATKPSTPAVNELPTSL